MFLTELKTSKHHLENEFPADQHERLRASAVNTCGRRFCLNDCGEANLTHYRQSVNKPSLASDDTTYTWGDALLGHCPSLTRGDRQQALPAEFIIHV